MSTGSAAGPEPGTRRLFASVHYSSPREGHQSWRGENTAKLSSDRGMQMQYRHRCGVGEVLPGVACSGGSKPEDIAAIVSNIALLVRCMITAGASACLRLITPWSVWHPFRRRRSVNPAVIMGLITLGYSTSIAEACVPAHLL